MHLSNLLSAWLSWPADSNVPLQSLHADIGGLKGDMAPELDPQQVPWETIWRLRMQEIFYRSGCPDLAGGAYSTPPCRPTSGDGTGCPIPKNPTSALGPLGLLASTLTRNGAWPSLPTRCMDSPMHAEWVTHGHATPHSSRPKLSCHWPIAYPCRWGLEDEWL